ncbi:Retrovirus-related Pol polyprotein from transposon RE1 [Vitis vinifera]|uniref:Retrovirus-related Pol polyprotein from transposon RE1 n=1 Tax=Vitis vinifera TaxID=29760 RepID=A0A438BYQ0_VITVI|nr:Retrovirus-related Pol polyprotein from transposon RE1 [Vitis vinifera]
MQVLNLKRDFKSLTMQEDETITKYSDIIALIVNKIRSLGEEFPDARIVEKVLVTLLERFESKISSLEESRDLSQISLVEMMNALQAQEQKRALRQENVTEGDLDKTYNSTVKVGNSGYVDVKEEARLLSKQIQTYGINGLDAITKRSLVELKKLELVEDMPNVSDEAQICEICQQGKQARNVKVDEMTTWDWQNKKDAQSDVDFDNHEDFQTSKSINDFPMRDTRSLEDIYQRATGWVVAPGKEDYVYLLRKALYGLKQAPRAWYETMDKYLTKLGFVRSQSEATLYVKTDDVQLLIVSLYVDDMLVTGNQPRLIQSFKDEMNKVFEMTDLGVMKYFWEWKSCNHVQEFSYANRSSCTHQVRNIFRQLKEFLRYIKGTIALRVQFSKSVEGDLKLLGYSDSDWGGCVDDSKYFRFEALKHKIGVCHPDAKEECLVVGIPDSKP